MKLWKKIKEQFGGTPGHPPGPITKTYPDPVLSSTHKKREHIPRRRLSPPPCIPGTITYRDRLVKHLGYDRRAADAMLKDWRENAGTLPKL